MQNNYVVYHLHSDLSNGVTNIDSVTKFPEYIAKAKELGMTALAFSEHGSVFSWYDKKEQIEAAGMKYIHAEEFYITAEVSPEKRLRDNWHCVLIAKNFDGVREINRLASKSFNRADGHYYYVPRISFDDLLSVSENIIITSACLGGILNRGDEEHQLAFLKYMSQHNDRCFLEIQHHNVKDQIEYNKRLVSLSREYNIPLIAGTDTHSLNAEHAKGRVVLQKAKDIRFDNEEGWDLTFKTYDELCAAYAAQNSVPQEVYLEAIENTNKMANMVETFEMDRHTKYPHIYDNPEETFKQKINEAFRNHPYARKRYTSKEIAPIIKEEFDVYKKVGAIDFMLLETYIREWEHKNDIQCGYGRGSVSGSMIAYLLGITQMDSIKFGLNFFRFMNPSRVSNADIDTDYCGKDRDRIKYFILHDKLGLPNIKTSEIITFNTIATKGAIKDVGRAMDMSLEDTQALSDSVDIDGKVPENIRKKYPELFEYVDIVSGTIVSIGSHPSGVLVSDKDIEGDVGLCSLSTSDYPVSMLDMHALDALMYVKLDILGLDNIGVINDTCKLLGIDRLTPDSVDLQDEAVWNDIKEDTTLIFQWESDSAKAYLDKFMSKETIEKAKQYNKDFSYIKWFSFGNGLIRPGCASFRNEVAEAKALVTGFKEFDEFLAPTLGRITMQEDIMRFCKQFCGYSDAESDTVRRAVSKKVGTENLLGEIHDRFLSYSHETYGVDEALLEKIFPPIKQGILDASDYAFSWNHSDAYSCIGYISGYLRHYHPLEFLTAAFNIFYDNTEKIADITRYTNKVGIKIMPIKFRHSRAEYSMDKANNAIYSGMRFIKYMNVDVAEKLYAMKDQHFNSFVDLVKVFPGDRRQLDILIKLGYFSEFGKSKKLLDIVYIYDKYGTKKIIKRGETILDEKLLNKYAISVTPKQYKFDTDSMTNLISELTQNLQDKSISLASRIRAELEYLGYIQTRIPDMEGYGVVCALKSRGQNFAVTIADIATGEINTVKMKHKLYENEPIAEWDIIGYKLGEEYPWTKNEDGKWVQDTSKQKQKVLAWCGVSQIYQP